MKAILNALARFQAVGEPTVLATVVATSGSTCRKPGAQMALTAGGAVAGLVRGGSMESDLVEIARESVFPVGRPRLVTYNTNACEEMVWGLNLGCDGTIEMLLEPAPGSAELAVLAEELINGAPFSLVCELAEPWRRCLVRQDGSAVAVGGAAVLALDGRMRADALALLERGACAAQDYDGVRVFVQSVSPAPRLVVFGAGHHAVPLVQMAAAVGWTITVVDHRPATLADRRFAGADRMVLASPDEAAAEAGVGAGDCCVMMTHNFGHDRVLLPALCEARPRYIGVFGPRARTKQLLRELRAAGFELPPESLKAVSSPLGLDVGGESPVEVALSAMAELQAVRYGRRGVRVQDEA